MICTVCTPDRERHVVTNEFDVMDLIKRYIGDDMVECVKEYVQDYKDDMDSKLDDVKCEMESMEYDYKDRLDDLYREIDSIESEAKKLKAELEQQCPDIGKVRSILYEILAIVC